MSNSSPAPRPTDLARILTASLGALWLLDGILQFQPAMFTGAFVQQVLAPTLVSQPHWMIVIIDFGIRVANINPFWFNVCAASIQLIIGTLLVLPSLVRRWQKAQHFALWLSIAWALIIWIFGEGLGMLATGSATFYTGAPGSALLYAIIAFFIIENVFDTLPLATGILFLIGAVLNLTPMFWQPTMLSMLTSIPVVSNWLGAFGVQGTMLGNFLAIDILAAFGIFLVFMPRNRNVAWIAFAFLVVIWWVGQNFGGIFSFPSGTATDPNSAVVLMLFLIPGMLA